mgnify:CR=1 FL=1
MEEIEIGETPNIDIKEIEINEGDNKYKCQIQIIKDFIQVILYSNNIIKYKGNIHISKIEYYLGIYNYNIEEIFEEINILNKDNFKIIKEMKKYKLKIEFLILRKKKYIYIDLNGDKNLKENDLINEISELKRKIKDKDNKIKSLEEELNKLKSNNKNANPDNINNISLKEPKYILNNHTNWVNCSTVLKDGRFVTGSADKSIIIYNNKTFQPDIIIKEHKDSVNNVIQLSSGVLASCSGDKTIKLYNINVNKYKVIQTLKYHTSSVNKIIELKNKQLVSCSHDKTIIFYNKDNNEYKKDNYISTDGKNGPIIQTKDNEICYHDDDLICFFDLVKRKINNKINNISIIKYIFNSMLMISNDLLLITGKNIISIINVNTYNLIRTIDASGSSWICATILINNNILLTADDNKRIIQWKIDGDKLELISKKKILMMGIFLHYPSLEMILFYQEVLIKQ